MCDALECRTVVYTMMIIASVDSLLFADACRVLVCWASCDTYRSSFSSLFSVRSACGSWEKAWRRINTCVRAAVKDPTTTRGNSNVSRPVGGSNSSSRPGNGQGPRRPMGGINHRGTINQPSTRELVVVRCLSFKSADRLCSSVNAQWAWAAAAAKRAFVTAGQRHR